MSPQKRNVQVLSPGTSERDLIWKQGLYGGGQAAMRFFGWALIQHEPRPYRKGGMGQRQTRSEEKTMWRQRRIPGGDQSDTRSWKRQRRVLPYRFQRGPSLSHLSSASRIQTVRHHIPAVLGHPVFTICYGSLRKLIHTETPVSPPDLYTGHQHPSP